MTARNDAIRDAESRNPPVQVWGTKDGTDFYPGNDPPPEYPLPIWDPNAASIAMDSDKREALELEVQAYGCNLHATEAWKTYAPKIPGTEAPQVPTKADRALAKTAFADGMAARGRIDKEYSGK